MGVEEVDPAREFGEAFSDATNFGCPILAAFLFFAARVGNHKPCSHFSSNLVISADNKR
jgi:hypothetical protein